MPLPTRLLLLAALAQPLAAAPPPAPRAWIYAGSDIPADPAWDFGVLPNGLRYAVRRNALPAGAVSVRVRVDAGGLMERPDESGYAHFMEHMAFRGTATVPDGEGVRIWQRLGANFGTDTNAYTTLTQTVYALDLPRADPAVLDTGVRLLGEMMQSARIDASPVTIERRVVIAERDLRLPPLQRKIQDAQKAVVLAGTKAARTDVTGAEVTLAAASPERLRAFYERWYRPERTTVTIVGDADPAALKTLLVRYFGGWRGKGPQPTEPDYGKPAQPPLASAVVADPQAPQYVSLSWPSQHDDRPWTQARQSTADLRDLAAGILSRRLTRAARNGASFVQGSADFDEGRHVADQAQIGLVPKPGAWKESLDQAYALLAQTVAEPPTQAEIDREVAVAADALQAEVAARPTLRSPQLANLVVRATDEGDVVAPPEYYAGLFRDARPRRTPAVVGAAMRALVAGDARAILLTPQPLPGGPAQLAQALVAAKATKASARADVKAVSLKDLGAAPTPGKIVSRTELEGLGATRVRFANGLDLIVKPAAFERDRVLVAMEVGDGIAGLDPRAPAPLWTSAAVVAGGVGPFDADALERATAGRRISLQFDVGDRHFTWAARTNAADLPDQLRLLAAAAREPRFDPAAIGRLTADYLGSYDSIFADPGSVFGTFADQPLHGGDARWAAPTPADITAMTPDAFRAFWSPLLAGGPRRLVIVGDVDLAKAIAATAATLGAETTKPAVTLPPARLKVMAPNAGAPPLTLFHRGDPNQIVAAEVWPTGDTFSDLPTSRALRVAADILSTRLYDRFREREGGTYTPSVQSSTSLVFPGYGTMLAYSQMRADRLDDFRHAVHDIAADLAANGPSADELDRAKAPILSTLARDRATDAYWLGSLNRELDDPRVLQALHTAVSGYEAIDAAAVRAAAKRYLSGAAALEIVVRTAAAVEPGAGAVSPTRSPAPAPRSP